MKSKPKIGDDVEFSFAGSMVRGEITGIDNTWYKVFDGKYKYSIHKEQITKLDKQ